MLEMRNRAIWGSLVYFVHTLLDCFPLALFLHGLQTLLDPGQSDAVHASALPLSSPTIARALMSSSLQ